MSDTVVGYAGVVDGWVLLDWVTSARLEEREPGRKKEGGGVDICATTTTVPTIEAIPR
jgi:hypothetical protein